MPETNRSIDSRVAALEESVQNIVSHLEKLERAIHGVQTTVVAQTRTPWALIIAAVTIIFSVFGWIFSLTYQPLKEKTERVEGVAIENRRDIAEMRAATLERLAEIETQFHGKYDASNLQIQTTYQLLNAVLRMHKLDPIDMPTYWPSSPGKPRIEK